jgi:small subunit ribosomal protein S16
MATKIRLRRMGTIGKPFYRVVVADSRFATTGRFLEILGWYDPKQKGANFSLNLERVNHWLGQGAQLSTTAKSLMKKAEAGLGAPVAAAENAAEQQEA